MSRKKEKERRKARIGKRNEKRKEPRSFPEEEHEEFRRVLASNEVLWGRILYTITETGVRKEPLM